MLHGRSREMGLGPYPTITLARAREKAMEVRRLKVEGIDPIEARDAQKQATRAASAKQVTFRECARPLHPGPPGGMEERKARSPMGFDARDICLSHDWQPIGCGD